MAFCKNCGNEMDDLAVVCVKCGTPKGAGASFCPHCGKPLMPGAAVCTACGVPVNNTVAAAGSEQKSKIAAGIMGILIGSLGIHNFYLGYTTKAVIQLVLTVATCGFGAAISGIWGACRGYTHSLRQHQHRRQGQPAQGLSFSRRKLKYQKQTGHGKFRAR